MIFAIAAAVLAAAQPQPLPPTPCPDIDTPQAYLCKALASQELGDFPSAAAAFEQAAKASQTGDPAQARMLAAAGNMWIAAGEPGKAALALDRALAGTSLQAEQRGEALLDRARAAAQQNDLKTARAKVTDAAQTISQDPFLWYFSASLAIREDDVAEAQSAIGRALSIAPGDATLLFEAGHVAHLAGELDSARAYWTRAIAADPSGPNGKGAREALALLDAPDAVQSEAPAAK